MRQLLVAVFALSSLYSWDSLAAEENATAACVPSCRDGFVCVSGACVSRCNPPCEEGAVCTSRGTCEFPPSSAKRTWGTILTVAGGLFIAGGLVNVALIPVFGTEDAGDLLTIGGPLLAAGIGQLTLGIILLRSSRSSSPSLSVAPCLGPSRAGLGISGTF